MGLWGRPDKKLAAEQRQARKNEQRTNKSISHATWVGALAAVGMLGVAIIAASRPKGDSEQHAEQTPATRSAHRAECAFAADPAKFASPPVTKYSLTAREDLVGTGFVNLRTGPCADGATAAGTIRLGASLAIVCQVRGSRVYGVSDVWNRLDNGKWVADYFVEGTLTDAFTPGIPECKRL